VFEKLTLKFKRDQRRRNKHPNTKFHAGYLSACDRLNYAEFLSRSGDFNFNVFGATKQQ